MAVEMLVGLHVTDDNAYQAYREAMMPILARYDGGFGYDLKIAETLRSETDAPINRIFTIFFRDEEAKDAFFSDEKYVRVKEAHFERSVAATTIIAAYER